MDQRVIRAVEQLREAGRLDLIAAPAAPRVLPARKAASGVAAAVAVCSPPRGRQQVSGAGKGRSGRLALASRGRTAGGSRRQPRPLGARWLQGPEVVEGVEAEQGAVKELIYILECRDESDQGGSDFKEQLVEDDGLKFQVRPPVRTYNGFARGESVSEGLVEVKGSGIERRAKRVGDIHVSDADMRFLQGGQCGSEGDPGELLTGLEPWEEEEVTVGPSTASCTGYRRGGEVVRAKELVTQYATGPGFAPPDGRVSMGQRPGYASQRQGLKRALRRPRIPAAQLEDLIKKARFGNGTRDADSDESAQKGVYMYCRMEQVQAETEKGHMTNLNGWEGKKTGKMLIG
ncbi:hypothetical protein NDU88_002374 [Pleurodeles waltl]|uniref:Uncharacterized protein n=1 Tax=Pleurodeles waltl TaxID=8319 RepID=A0AAV7P980_PLEWA|nr:hypothetical protein NDU88_002374 [Pleurodeles waltl]